MSICIRNIWKDLQATVQAEGRENGSTENASVD